LWWPWQAWKENILPFLEQHIAHNIDSFIAYQLLCSETVLASLLEVCLYLEKAWEALAEDALLELCDWCYRKLVFLNTFRPQISKGVS
jgi:hypothetical protein